jgi:hypothetical protein
VEVVLILVLIKSLLKVSIQIDSLEEDVQIMQQLPVEIVQKMEVLESWEEILGHLD